MNRESTGMKINPPKKLEQLEKIISKMPLEVCCMVVPTEFGLRWRDVADIVCNYRLPMHSRSVARVVSRHVARNLDSNEVADAVARLTLFLTASQQRKWHVIDLKNPTQEEISVYTLIRKLPARVADAARTKSGKKRAEVHTIVLDDLLYMSVRRVSDSSEGAALYVCTLPGEPVALVSSLTSSLIRPCAQGLGYNDYSNADLNGPDVRSLLRIHNSQCTDYAENLTCLPPYNPVPVLTSNGIDYTNKTYNENYVENILGPNPPLLTELTIKCAKPFYDPSKLQENISVAVQIKSDNIAETLKCWAKMGVIPPTSDLFTIFHKIKSNVVVCDDDDGMEED